MSGQQQKQQRRGQPSARTHDVDIHLAAKVSREMANDINHFKTKLQTMDFAELDHVFAFVPPTIINQQLPKDIYSYRSYLPRFTKGSPNGVVGFIKWVEWANYVASKGKHFAPKGPNTGTANNNKPSGAQRGSDDDDDDENERNDDEEEAAAAEEAEGNETGPTERPRKVSQSRAALAQTAKEREHMRSLLQMCLRHNSTKRKEGQHALINHLSAHLPSNAQKCNSIEQLRAEAHHSIPYALSRLLLGMATENLAHIVLNCHALFLVLQQTKLSPRVVLSLIEEELNLTARLRAIEMRMGSAVPAGAAAEDADEIDPDDLNDPTKGERNQRISAAVFAVGAVVASERRLSVDDVKAVMKYLSFAYVEHKGCRVLTANIMFMLLARVGMQSVLADPDTWHWVSFALFRFVKLEYFRPEAVQLMIKIMSSEQKPPQLAPALKELAEQDPLEPSMLEKIANALFRREQVVAYHPMVHPVWDDLLQLVEVRCQQGESLKQHLTSIVHNLIAPYRRGSADSPRRILFQHLVDKVGGLALRSTDAAERMDVVNVAGQTVGFGKTKVPKATDPTLLRHMPLEHLGAKVVSLVEQFKSIIADNTQTGNTTRTWILKELRACLIVPVREGCETPYVDTATTNLLQFGFFAAKCKDQVNMNRAIYLFADTLSFTYTKQEGALCRPKAKNPILSVISAYLAAEEKKKTRFNTGLHEVKFRKARNKIVDALESTERSVLFYDPRDFHILLALLFLCLSVDDAQNDGAIAIAASVVPDLVKFYKTGTIETVALFIDVLMALVTRSASPLHVMPLMTCIRRVAISYLYRFARFIQDKSTLDLVLAPLMEAYRTDEREVMRHLKDARDEESEEEEDEKTAGAAEDEESDEEEESEEDEEEDDEEEEDEEASDAATEQDDAEDEEQDDASAGEEDDEDDADSVTSDVLPSDDGNVVPLADDDEDDDAKFEEEEKPTQQYLDHLKHMVGDVDLGYAYPTDTESRGKSDVVRAITVATRVTLAVRHPCIIRTFQVLLAVMRNNVKGDEVIFQATKSSIQMIMMSRNRYFGKFVPLEEIFQLLGDIQSYCRKLERSILGAKSADRASNSALYRKRLDQLKCLALSVFHYVTYLANKNHAGEDIRIALAEYYSTIFFGRGWNAKTAVAQMKKDLYHYRHAFAWALLPAVVEKFNTIKAVEGVQRVYSFVGCCTMIESVLSRIAGLPQVLKERTAKIVRDFLQSLSLKSIFDMKHTLLHTYFHCLKMSLEYNSKVNIDVDWACGVVDTLVDDDAILVSAATIRLVVVVEKLLSKTPRVKAIKPAVPVQVLHKQFEATWRKQKSEFYRKAKRARTKVVGALLAKRNDDPTDEERAVKRRRREDLKVRDREERQALRKQRLSTLTKEEKVERRKRMTMAKQDRIAKNRDRKMRVHETRTRAFEKWKSDKLADVDEDQEA